MKVKAIFFDLDGTLLPMDQSVFVRAYLGGLCRQMAICGYDPEKVKTALITSINALKQNDGKISNEELFWKHFSAILGNGVREIEPHLNEYYHTEYQKIKDLCGYSDMPRKILDLAKERGVITVLATNPLFPAIATESRIRWAGLCPEDFHIYTTYENSSYSKPNLKYYSDLLSRLGLKGEECAMIGNDVGDDMVTEALGMKTFLITECLINNTERSIEEFRHGGYPELYKFIKEITNE